MSEMIFQNYDILISYSTKRARVAQDIYEALEETGLKVWMAPSSIPAGSDYPDEIYSAIDNSEMVLFVLCEESLNSSWCANELRYSIAQNKKVLPVQIAEINNPYAAMGSINRRLSKKQIFMLYPEYRERIENLRNQSRALLYGKTENVVHPYPKDNYDYDENARFFVGREKETEELHALLVRYGKVNLYGMGGIGKTALMRKFFAVYEERDAYHSMHVASFVISLQNTIARIPFVGFDETAYLDSLEKTPDFSKTEALYEKKLEFLGRLSGECLLVIDGADHCSDAELQPLLNVGCSVIVTSRKRYPAFAPYHLLPMEKEALTDMFFSYARMERTPEEERSVAYIAERVGNHTLTVKLLACYCYNMGMSAKELSEEDFFDNLAEYDTEEEKISTLFKISELNEKEIYALRVLALFPNGVGKGKLQKIEREPLHTIPSLVKKGWVLASESSYSLHQIVQQSVLNSACVTTENLKPFLQSFAEVFRSVGFDNAELHCISRTIFKHVKGNDYLAALLFHRIGTFIGDYSYADTFHISKDVYESQDMNFYNRVNADRVSYENFEESFKMNSKALEISLALRPPQYDLNSFIISCMGSARFNQNNFQAAFELQKRALKEVQKGNNENNPVMLIVVNRLGLTALETGDFDLAEKSFLKYLEITQLYHPKTGNASMALFNLGNLAFRRADYLSAEKFYLQSERENTDDRSTSFGLSELWLMLAFVCKNTGRLGEARAYYEKSLAVKRNVFTDIKDVEAFKQKYEALF